TITPQGLAGGGMVPGPGEISLAHHGVLFLDELAEFRRETLEILRQPMEEHCVKLARLAGNYEFPSDFMLVAAMNPCRCGYYPDLNRCHCTKGMVEQYLKKISQPLLDRIDICVETKRVEYQDLIKENPYQETSAEIRKRVVAAMERQQQRFAGTNIRYNSRIPAALLTKYCRLSTKQKQYMESIYQKLELTARSYHRILRVARTIADMDGSDEILTRHLSEAVCYRNVDKKFWEG
ncbi:MAG: ATP-binding protein, partial [Roseburia sp.]